MFYQELNDNTLLREKSLFNQNKSLNNRIQKKRNLDNVLDYDNFLKEIYTIPKQTIVKKTEIKKINKKVKKYSINKGIFNLINSKVDVMKTSIKKKNNSLKNSSLYDLDNFIISSNTSKTFKKEQINLKIFTPNYKTLETKFFQSPNFFISKPSDKSDDDLNNDEVVTNSFQDISDETYLKYHNEFERREREYRINFFNHKKQKSKTLKKVDYDDNNITISKFEENMTNRENIS